MSGVSIGILIKMKRKELNIPQDATVLLYLGRLNREKGVLDLANAFAELAKREQSLRLLLVGPDEEGIYSEVKHICASCMEQIVRVGFTKTPDIYMKAADIFCLPSYREGFGSSVIEAAACGVPTVASKIYGLTDAVQDEITGLLHSPGEIIQITTTLNRLIANKDSCRAMGLNARISAEIQFSQEHVTAAMRSYYAGIFECV
jgi:glycosyltransferase involved in cell wall biosynthesis